VLDVAQGLTHADQRILDGCMRRETRLLCGKRPVNKTSFLSTRLYCVGMLHALDYQQDFKRPINRTSLCSHAARKHIYIYIYIYIHLYVYISSTGLQKTYQQDFKMWATRERSTRCHYERHTARKHKHTSKMTRICMHMKRNVYTYEESPMNKTSVLTTTCVPQFSADAMEWLQLGGSLKL